MKACSCAASMPQAGGLLNARVTAAIFSIYCAAQESTQSPHGETSPYDRLLWLQNRSASVAETRRGKEAQVKVATIVLASMRSKGRLRLMERGEKKETRPGIHASSLRKARGLCAWIPEHCSHVPLTSLPIFSITANAEREQLTCSPNPYAGQTHASDQDDTKQANAGRLGNRGVKRLVSKTSITPRGDNAIGGIKSSSAPSFHSV